jgi:hypothetical protein
MTDTLTQTAPRVGTIAAPIPAPVARLVNLHGQFATLTMRRPLKVKKGVAETIKESRFTVRIGVNYDNQKAVQEKRESGDLPAENAGLIGREWVVFPYILRSLKTGKFQVRCTPIHNNPMAVREVHFYRDGKEITRAEAEVGAYASEFAEREPTDAFDITVDNITHVNGEALA